MLLCYLNAFSSGGCYMEIKNKILFSIDDSTKMSTIPDIDYRWIKINPGRLLTDEVQIIYEKSINEYHAWEFRAGYIYSNPLLQGIAGGFYFSPYFYPKGFLVGVGFRIYRKNDRYTQYGICYKYKGYDTKEFWTGGLSGTGSENFIYLNQYFNILTFQLSFGRQLFTRLNTFRENYMGVGFNLMYAKTNYIRSSRWNPFTGGYEVTDEDKLKWDNGIYLIPTMHIGIKLGKRIKSKE
ncbi:MAG: hypothetical protein ACOZCO_06625 [Bacteroidota bacterium]